jgi:hypothetical protein
VRACIIQNGHISLPDPRLFFFSFSGISDSTRTAALYVRRTSKPLEANLKFHPSPIFYYFWFVLFSRHFGRTVFLFFNVLFYSFFSRPFILKFLSGEKKKDTDKRLFLLFRVMSQVYIRSDGMSETLSDGPHNSRHT